MRNKKSKHTTIETLSAYLDGQLSDAEAQILRQRLAEDGALRTLLEDLRQTRNVLRQTPKLKRRRSFVLSPEMVRKQKTVFRAMNVSRVISATASVLLVVALGSQYLLSGGMGTAFAPAADMAEVANYAMDEQAAEEAPMMMMEEPAEEMEAAPAEPAVADEPVEEMPATAPAVGEAADAEDSAPAAEMDVSAEGDGLQGTSEPGGGGGVAPTGEVMGSAALTATPEGTQRNVPSAKSETPAGEAGDADLDDSLAPEPLPTMPIELPVEEPTRESQIEPLQMVQGLLLVLAVAGGLAAAYFRKKVR